MLLFTAAVHIRDYCSNFIIITIIIIIAISLSL